MSKQFAVVSKIAAISKFRKVVAALVLAAALTGLPVLAANVPGPVGTIFAQPAYACPMGGECG